MAAHDYPARNRHGFIHWLTHVKLFHLVFMLVLILITVPLVAHYYISNMGADNFSGETFRSRTKLDHTEDLANLKPADLKFRIEELKRIKASVNNELRELESKRQKLHSELTTFNVQIDSLKNDINVKTMEFQQIQVNIQSQKLEQTEWAKKQTPEVQSPKQVLPPLEQEVQQHSSPRQTSNCRMHNCFDYSRCSLTSHFPVYLYNPEDYQLTKTPVDSFVKLSATLR